jgi:hypothetical protein
MPWFKVDDGFANSKPVLRIPRRYRCAAIGLWTLAGTWSAKELTDGFIPDYTLEDFCSTAPMAAQLVKAGLWEESSSGWLFVGWEKYQFTKAKVLEHRAAEAEKKRKWREAKQGIADQQEPEMSPRDTLGDNSGTPEGTGSVSTSTRPDQTRPVPSSLETLGGGVTSVDARQTPRPHCKDHEENSPDPCPACLRRRKWDEAREEAAADELEAQRQKRRHLVEVIEDCPDCDQYGRRDDLSDCPKHLTLKEAK